ncbi:MAG TPA: hypothetical protein VHZ24_20555 [Pirellulales bacterium]|jgi:hypothetical protein|nr:hypothetical protein [Pirellulales bacterium]
MKTIGSLLVLALFVVGLASAAAQGPPPAPASVAAPPAPSPGSAGWSLPQVPASDRETSPAPRRSSVPFEPTAGDELLVRDPTQPSVPLRDAIEATRATPQGSNSPLAMPIISIRARVIGNDAEPMAVLAVDGKYQVTVMEGGEYMLSPNLASQTMKVLSISTSGIEVEVLPAKRKLILH